MWGHIDIEVENPGPNRTVYFNWKAFMRCQMLSGGPPRQGEVKFDVVVDPPVVGDPSFWEGAIDFFLGPIDWSRRISDGIRAQLSTPSSQSSTLDLKCMTVGSFASGTPQEDAFIFAVTPPNIVGPRREATIRLISLTRKPVPSLKYTPPPEPGSFSFYVNGVPASIPGLPGPLPPAGGSVLLNMCKTINMDGSDRIQLLFTNSLGGTTWSQFGAVDNYGVGRSHAMTTGRNVVVPGTASPANPHPKPEVLRLNEFELTYAIEHSNNPVGAVGPLSASGGIGTAPPPPPGPNAGVKGAPAPGQVKGLPAQVPLVPPQPCRPL